MHRVINWGQRAIRDFIQYLGELKRRPMQYLLLAFIPNLIIIEILQPLYHELASWVLKLTGIPYLSHDTIGMVLTNPVALGLLLAILILLLITAFAQVSLMIVGVIQIMHDRFSIRNLLNETWTTMKISGPRSLWILVSYFLLIIPFGGLIYRSSVFDKITIPEFIEDYMLQHWSLTLILVIFYLSVAYLAVRRIYTFPIMVSQQVNVKTASHLSKQATQHHWPLIFLKIIVTGFLASALASLVYYGIWGLQKLADLAPYQLSLILGIFNLTLIKLLGQFMTAMFAVLMVFLILPQAFAKRAAHLKDISLRQSLKTAWQHLPDKMFKIGAALTAVIYLGIVAFNSALFLLGVGVADPLVISHRGVDGNNGVQNMIPALESTVKRAHPDYVEIDIQETKDHQFVVMHDSNLEELCGVDKAPQDLTLKRLTHLKASENGHTAPVASFDDYLKRADELNQKLLVEIKVSDDDSPDMMKRFLTKYQKRLESQGNWVHSLSWDVINYLTKNAPQLKVSAILPMNIIYPQTKAAAYTMEASTLNDAFVTRARLHHQKVLAWTVNDPIEMDQMIFMKVDGIITDYPSTLKKQARDLQDNPDYADRLLLYVNGSGLMENTDVAN